MGSFRIWRGYIREKLCSHFKNVWNWIDYFYPLNTQEVSIFPVFDRVKVKTIKSVTVQNEFIRIRAQFHKYYMVNLAAMVAGFETGARGSRVRRNLHQANLTGVENPFSRINSDSRCKIYNPTTKSDLFHYLLTRLLNIVKVCAFLSPCTEDNHKKKNNLN